MMENKYTFSMTTGERILSEENYLIYRKLLLLYALLTFINGGLVLNLRSEF